MTNVINFNIETFNHLLFELKDCKDKYVINKGWFATGKTYAATDNELIKSFEGNHQTLVIRRGSYQLRHSVITLFKQRISDLKIDAHFEYSITNRMLRNKSTGCEIWFRGMNEPLPALLNAKRVFVDDASELLEEDLTELHNWSRMKKVEQFVFNLNPYECPLKDKFIDSGMEGVKVINSLMKDNKYLNPKLPEHVEKMKNNLPELYHAIKTDSWLKLELA